MAEEDAFYTANDQVEKSKWSREREPEKGKTRDKVMK